MPIDLIKKYGLPAEVRYCSRCTISNQRPRITFNSDGVCSACQFAKYKRTQIDWGLREKELLQLLDRYRSPSGAHDVIVPCSGGKDGSFVAHQLKTKYGMNPLCVTWAPNIPTALGIANLERFVASGFSHQMGAAVVSVNQRMVRLATEQLGDPFQPFIYGQTNYPMKIAVERNIPLIFYGENGEVEYGGDMKNAHRPNRDISDHVKHYFSGLKPEYWTEQGIGKSEITPYLPPNIDEIQRLGMQIHFFSYYKFWDPQENYYYAAENVGFQANAERSEGTYSKYASLDDKLDGFHYYFGFIKFGIGRTTSDTAHEIRDAKITRDEGIALVRRFDGEYPKKYLKEFLEYCSMTPADLETAIDQWRSPHIWTQSNDQWVLNKSIYASL